MKARVKEKWDVAKGTLMVTFDLLGAEVDFGPGQYFYVTLPDVGHQDDKGFRRHITVVTSPTEKGVLGLATRMRDSAFKRSLRDFPVGAEVEVEQPEGDFVLPDDTSRPLVLIAGGIGITVFRSMLLYVKEERLSHRIVLVCSNRDRESTAFLDELHELEQQIPGLRLILTMTDDPGWEGRPGRSIRGPSRTSSATISGNTRFLSPARRRRRREYSRHSRRLESMKRTCSSSATAATEFGAVKASLHPSEPTLALCRRPVRAASSPAVMAAWEGSL